MVDKLKNYVSPKAVFKYPHLTKADTKFNPDGEFKVTLCMKPDAAKDFVNLIEDEFKKSIELAKERNQGKTIKSANLPYKINEETGDVEATFKLKAVGKSSKTGNTWSQKPAIIDANGTPMQIEEIIYGGSEGKVSFNVVPWYTPMLGASVTLRLKAVQILKLVTAAEGAGESYGFQKEEGYQHQQKEMGEVTADASDF